MMSYGGSELIGTSPNIYHPDRGEIGHFITPSYPFSVRCSILLEHFVNHCQRNHRYNLFPHTLHFLPSDIHCTLILPEPTTSERPMLLPRPIPGPMNQLTHIFTSPLVCLTHVPHLICRGSRGSQKPQAHQSVLPLRITPFLKYMHGAPESKRLPVVPGQISADGILFAVRRSARDPQHFPQTRRQHS